MPRTYRPSFEVLEDRTLPTASIAGSVWQDLNQDAVRAAEPGLAGVIVFIDDGTHVYTGTQQHVQTNGAGDYTFTGLVPGSYELGLVLPIGQSLTFPTGSSFQSITLQNNDTASGVDFGVLANPVEPTDQQVTSDSSVQQQPSIAVNPNDPTHVVMAYMDYGLKSNGYAGIGIKVSHDSGATWTTSSVPLPVGFDQAAGQATVQFDGTGKVHVSFMAATFLGQDSNGSALKPGVIYDTTTQTVAYLNKTVSRREFGMQANNGVFVATSDDGGLTWNQPVSVSSQRYDQTATTSPTAVAVGSNVVTPAVNPSGLFVGKTLIIDEGLANMERVKVTAFTGTTFTATFSKAHAAGFTISAPVFFDTQPDLAIDNNQFLPDGSSNPNYGNQYVTWTRFYPAGLFPGQTSSVSGSEIMFAVSTDGGQTWTTRTQTVGGVQFSAIKDPLTGSAGTNSTEGTGSNTLPRVTVDPEGGVYVSQSAGSRFSIFYSTDAGATFRNPDPGTGTAPYVTSGYPFGLDDDRYTAIYPVGAGTSSFIPGPTLFNNSFRTQAVRDIVADPSRPGTIYAVESVQILDTAGNVLDRGEITFARSTDYGVTWTTVFTVGSDTGNVNELAADQQFRYRGVLNDDNDTRFIGFDSTLQDEVISGQALPQMSVDADGNIAVIWYDTRRDPANTRLDVYGTVSTDGGLTFSANNRITSTNFDANTGVFTDARNAPNFYLGDRIGLALANGQVYAAWTDTTAGNQDIYFSRYSLTPAPLAEDDRYEPNDTPGTATDLGTVTSQRIVPRLGLATGDADWFRLQAGATGPLFIAATASTAGTSLNIELYDASGTTLLASGTAANLGAVAGQHLVFQEIIGTNYLVKVTGSGPYSLLVQPLTADLGTSVEGTVTGANTAGAQSIYRLVTGIGGSLSVSLTSGADTVGNLNLTILSADGLTVLATSVSAGAAGPGEVETATISVLKGQVVLIQVSGTPSTSGSYEVAYAIEPHLTVSQSIVSPPIYRGKGYTYTITLSNLGSAAVSGVTLRDVLPTNAVLVKSLPGGSVSANVLTINVGTIAGKSSKTILVRMKVPFTTAIGASIENNISVQAAVSGAVDLDSNMYSFIVAKRWVFSHGG